LLDEYRGGIHHIPWAKNNLTAIRFKDIHFILGLGIKFLLLYFSCMIKKSKTFKLNYINFVLVLKDGQKTNRINCGKLMKDQESFLIN